MLTPRRWPLAGVQACWRFGVLAFWRFGHHFSAARPDDACMAHWLSTTGAGLFFWGVVFRGLPPAATIGRPPCGGLLQRM